MIEISYFGLFVNFAVGIIFGAGGVLFYQRYLRK